MKSIFVALGFGVFYCGSAHPDCEPPHAIQTQPAFAPTQEELDARYHVYLEACTKAGGDLIDAGSVTYHDRIRGGGIAETPAASYPEGLLRRGISGEVTVAAIVEPTGKISKTLVVRTSGNSEFDNDALDQVRHYKFRQPYTVDGVPVRVFKTFLVTYHTGGQ